MENSDKMIKELEKDNARMSEILHREKQKFKEKLEKIEKVDDEIKQMEIKFEEEIDAMM